MFETILVVGIVVACTVWYMQRAWRRHVRILTKQHSAELRILGERYCRGEIDREEYLQKRGDVIGHPLVEASR